MRIIIFIFTLLTFMNLQAQEGIPTKKHFWHTMETTAPSSEIWKIWTDVSNWKQWDSGLKDASINGTLMLNSTGVITSLNGRESKFKVVEFDIGKSYTFKTKLPLGSLNVKRHLETKNGKVFFTHEVWFKGITKGIFAKAFGGEFMELLPKVLLNIKEIAEQHDGH